MEKQWRYFIKLAYNGSRFLGWQIQRQGPTVQEVVNDALSKIFRSDFNVVGCGRTDTGVHAREFYAHFDLPYYLEPSAAVQQLIKLNGLLPNDIFIFKLLPVRQDAHARFSATRRTYKYQISTRKDPFLNEYAYIYRSKLDLKKMNEAAKILFEYVDFTSFSKVNTQVRTNNCQIYEASWVEIDNLLIFTITADRFLRNMVRAIVGTFLDVGRGKLSVKGLREVIEGRDRSLAGYSVPPHGLYLQSVEYPEDIFLSGDFS